MPEGQAFRARFSVEAMAESVLAVYRACLNGTQAEAAAAPSIKCFLGAMC